MILLKENYDIKVHVKQVYGKDFVLAFNYNYSKRKWVSLAFVCEYKLQFIKVR